MKKLLFYLFLLLNSSLFSQTFIKDLGLKDIDDGITCITKSNKGFILAGYYNKSAFLQEIDYSGNVIWRDIYHITDQKDLITDLKYIDGKIIACGYGYYEGTGNFLEFYFKYDIKSKQFDWIKKSKLALKPSNIHVLPNGNLLMTGDEIMVDVFKVFLMEINPKNGKMLFYSSWIFTGNESASSSLIYNNNIYLGGRYALEKRLDKYRGSITKFDLNFNEVWSNYYLNKREKYVRNYLTKLIIDEGEIISIYATNNHGTSNHYSVSLAKQNTDGELLWAKEYKINNYENIRIRDIKAYKNGFYLFGVTVDPNENFFLINVDKEGTVLWAKTYGENNTDNVSTDQGNFIELTSENIYLVGQSKNLTKDKDYNSIFIKLNLDGTSDKDCWGTDVETNTIPFKELVQGGIVLTGNDSIFINNNLAFKKETKLKNFKSLYFCYPKLAINDFDTIRKESTIFIDFKKNDIIPADEKVFFRLISDPINAEAKIENGKIKYIQKNIDACVIDSFQYEISSSLGKDSAKIYVYAFKSENNIVVDSIMTLNNSMVLESGYKSSNIKYFWNNNKITSDITIQKFGNYYVEILKDNCLFKKTFNISENPYSFEEIATTNITFMLDVSISMNRENRLPVLKKALYKILTFMRDEDKLSIINYSDDAQIIFDGIKATDIDTIKTKIESLESQGTSDIKKGLKMAIQTINNNNVKGGNNRIIFTTDGDISNENRKELIEYIQKELPENVYFSLFLFNDASIFKDQMNSVIESVDGNLYVITPDNIERILLKEFKSVRK